MGECARTSRQLCGPRAHEIIYLELLRGTSGETEATLFRQLDCFRAPGAPVNISCTGLDPTHGSDPNRALVRRVSVDFSLTPLLRTF